MALERISGADAGHADRNVPVTASAVPEEVLEEAAKAGEDAYDEAVRSGTSRLARFEEWRANSEVIAKWAREQALEDVLRVLDLSGEYTLRDWIEGRPTGIPEIDNLKVGRS